MGVRTRLSKLQIVGYPYYDYLYGPIKLLLYQRYPTISLIFNYLVAHRIRYNQDIFND
ncbi:MAG: hypothetical protein GY782_00200 [Gammaproteobacteria bacterium]|nr:hypothetical protein [Gammaproteobacteria bacterium]